MNRALRLLEACLLGLMGAFMIALPLSGSYHHFLNPKYEWLTFSAGGVILILAVTGLLHRERKAKISELLALALFLVVAATAVTHPPEYAINALQDPAEGPVVPMRDRIYVGGSLTLHYNDDNVNSPTIKAGDREYVKINVAELVAGEREGWLNPGGSYAIQGTVIRTRAMDEKGYIGVARLFISCCFADATGVICLVKVGFPDGYEPGTWVRVLGTLAKASPFGATPMTFRGALSTVHGQKYVLEADNVARSPVMGGAPFMFEIRDRQPFAY